MSRLAAGIWVAAYRKRLDLHGIACFVTRRGDETSGAVMVKLATMDGQAKLFQREFDLMTDTREWRVLVEGAEAEVDASARKQAGFDPDLWLLEVEDRQGRHLLDEEGLQ